MDISEAVLKLLRVLCMGYVAASACASIVGFAAQNPVNNNGSATTTIKSEVQLVLVDAVVTGADGKPVEGLPKEEFQVFENGKPQVITSFDEHKGVISSSSPLPSMPTKEFTNFSTTAKSDSVNVLLLDSLNTQAADQSFVRAQMIKYLEAAAAAPTGARVAIFTLGSRLRMVRGFTDDSSALLAALEDRGMGLDPRVMRQLATPAQKASDSRMVDSQMSQEGRAAIRQFLEEEASGQARDRAWMTLQAFQQLARFLSPIPGRKNLMWVSGSFPIDFFPHSAASPTKAGRYQADIQQTATQLTAEQVAVYPILATGLTTDTAQDGPDFTPPIPHDNDERAFNQISMETIAKDTGGKAFYNSNNLNQAMAQAIELGSHYYTIAYTPENTRLDGKYRRIELKTSNHKLRLSYRRGYYAASANFISTTGSGKSADLLMPLMAFGMPEFQQILYKVRYIKAKSEGKVADGNPDPLESSARCSVDFAISVADLSLQKSSDGVRRGHIEVMMTAFDKEGKLLNWDGDKGDIALDEKAYSESLKAGLQMHREIGIPNQELLLRTGIYDLNSGKVGTVELWISPGA